MKQAVAEYANKKAVLDALEKRYRESSEAVRIARISLVTAKYWMAEWAGVPRRYVSNAIVHVSEDRIDIYFGAPDGSPLDPLNHLHAHYIFDGNCEIKMRRERNVVRKTKEEVNSND